MPVSRPICGCEWTNAERLVLVSEVVCTGSLQSCHYLYSDCNSELNVQCGEMASWPVAKNPPTQTQEVLMKCLNNMRASKYPLDFQIHVGAAFTWRLLSFMNWLKPNLLNVTPLPEFFQPVQARSYTFVNLTSGFNSRVFSLGTYR